MMADVADVLYRYEERRTGHGCDESGDALRGHTLSVEVYTFPVTKRTPQGAWIDNYGEKKFVLLTAKKRFACNTRQEAIMSFIFRKNRQISVLSAQLEEAKTARAIAEGLYIDPSSCSSFPQLVLGKGGW